MREGWPLSARHDNRNLVFEVVSLLLFLAALFFVWLAVLMTAVFLGSELLPEPGLTEGDRARFGPFGYVISLGVFLVPAAAIGFFLFAIRFWLVKRPVPEAGTWDDREPKLGRDPS